jgi:L-serine dehydratase
MANQKIEQAIYHIKEQVFRKPLTLGELVELAERADLSLSQMVVAQSMINGYKSYNTVLSQVMESFAHNSKALEVGLTWGKSFLLGSTASELAKYNEATLFGDLFINRALIYTLATEVGNHEIGLQPCAGTGDSCVYTGLLRALKESGFPVENIALAAALMLKVGSYFRVGKKTTGCNMEGFGAGAAATAAALTDIRGGNPRQVSKAIVLALSPTIAVPCTPRVMASGLCAAHIGGAILLGNLAANLILKTSLPVDIDVDVMLAMAAKIHSSAAPVITPINLHYLEPFFKKESLVEQYVESQIKKQEQKSLQEVLLQAKGEVRQLAASVRPITQAFDNIVVGGSSIAVGSPTNMARICHHLVKGEIKKIEIELTVDLFSRRAINVPSILMAAIFGVGTDNTELYKKILSLPELRNIEIRVNKTDVPEVQRIRIEATENIAMVDARNRGGGRVAILNALPSKQEAIDIAKKLGIEVVD